VVGKHVEAHRAYLTALYNRGKVLAFGPQGGGAVLLRVEDERELAAISEGDPFRMAGVATHDAHVWVPTMGGNELEALASRRTA
jgi:uncharacterized protein YciI